MSPHPTPGKGPAAPHTQPGDLIPTLSGSPRRVTHAEMQTRTREDGKGIFGFVLVFTEPTSSDER